MPPAEDPRVPYYRERYDRAVNARLDRLESKVDALSTKLALVAGGLGLLSVVVNIVGPAIIAAALR